VIDVQRWRDREVSARALVHAERIGDRLVLHDQDALNCALQGDWTELPRDWNAGVPVSDWLTEDSRAVFHYWGAPKPWHADYDGRFRALYIRYIDRTAYAGQRAWDPFGLGRLLARAQRAVPFLPAVLRAARGVLRPPDTAPSDTPPRR
jgi:lipopolysaccharide biosynthesis glycosyltransferase